MISERLKQLRIIKKLRQTDVAELIGVGRTTYTNYETGVSEPDIDTINKLASIFNVSADYLLERTDDLNSGSDQDLPPNVKILLRDAQKLTPDQLEAIHRLVKEFVNEK